MFTRQHYQLIAETISKIESMETRRVEAEKYASLFSQYNNRFSADLFLFACGVVGNEE